jgi:hypothetical protein
MKLINEKKIIFFSKIISFFFTQTLSANLLSKTLLQISKWAIVGGSKLPPKTAIIYFFKLAIFLINI